MFRRMMIALAALATLVVPSATALGAEAQHLQLSGTSVSASFSNFPEDKESPPPGDYFYTNVFAAEIVTTAADEHFDDYVCVDHFEFSIDENGEWLDGQGIWVCGQIGSLTLDRRLTSARLIASLPVTDCLAWDEETGECLEPVELGTLEVDLTLTGVGLVERQRGISTGGTAGSWAFVWHGVGVSRSADPSGTVALDGASLIDGATTSSGWIGKVQEGYVEVATGG